MWFRMKPSYKKAWQSFLQNNQASSSATTTTTTAATTLSFNTGLQLSIHPALQDIPIFIAPFIVYDPTDCLLFNQKDSHDALWKKFATENAAAAKASVVPREETVVVDVGDMDGYEPTRWYALRPWPLSRQRKWGTPIPILECRGCGGIRGVCTDQLPITHEFLGKKSAASSRLKCHECGGHDLVHESQTLDTFFDSSWYYLRFLDVNNEK